MKKLKIAKELSLPLDAVTQKLAWLGRTGSGKTYGCKRMVEEMIRAGAQVVILDPVGVWAGLRLGPQALDVAVLGGLFGDIPLEHTAGALVADLVVDTGASMVLDLSQALDAPRTRFAQAFAERFFLRKKADPAAVHLVIEECQEFIPQNHQHGEEKMLHEFQRIAKLGRNFGIGLSLISQRPQEVNKKALNQAECVFAFQLTGPHERKALEYWLSDKGADGGKLGDMLPRLAIGAPHVWSPQWLKISEVVHILPIETQDTSQTPKVGEKAFAQRKLKPIDLGALKAAMSATLEKAKQEDPSMLRARIAELEREVMIKAPAPPERIEVPIVSVAMIQRLEEALSQLLPLGTQLDKAVYDIRLAITDAKAKQVEVLGLVRPQKVLTPLVRLGRSLGGVRVPPASAPKVDRAMAGPDLPPMQRLILTAAAQLQGKELSLERLAMMAGYHARSKSFRNALGALRSRGCLQGTMITDSGLSELGPYDPLPTGRAALTWFCENKLTPAEGNLLSVIAAVPASATIDDVAKIVDKHPRSKAFRNNLGRLRSMGLVDGLRLAAGLR